MKKIAIIGAGSIVFCKTLIMDILATPALQDTRFALMAPTMRRSAQVGEYVEKFIKHNGLPASVEVTTSQREALRGAHFVIATFQVGGVEAFGMDVRIPMKYGVNQCIGDSMGPGGIMRAARSIPVCAQLARDMRELCPGALLLNYVNPMAMVCWALGEFGMNFVGCCHGVQTTLDLISGYVGVPKHEIDFLCAGINHMAWFLQLRHRGSDLYPLLRERFEQPGHYVNEKVRGEVMRHFGYFMTESTGHLSEYVPWFRKTQAALETYCDEPAFGGEYAAYLKWSEHVEARYKDKNLLEGEPLDMPSRSIEYGSYIIEAITTGKTFRFNGNIRNEGAIGNLPVDCCAEVPIYADATGLHPVNVGNLPPQCAALNMTNILAQQLGTHAALTGDAELLVQAMALDPLTAASLTLKETRDMAAEMLEAQKRWLPQFEGKSVRTTPTISIPHNVERAEVPVDPALAIMARFGSLAGE